MSGKFHIDGKGNAAPCSATQRVCPLRGEHYDTQADAMRAAMEKRMAGGISEVEATWVVGELRRTLGSEYGDGVSLERLADVFGRERVDVYAAAISANKWGIGTVPFSRLSDDDYLVLAPLLNDGHVYKVRGAYFDQFHDDGSMSEPRELTKAARRLAMNDPVLAQIHEIKAEWDSSEADATDLDLTLWRAQLDRLYGQLAETEVS